MTHPTPLDDPATVEAIIAMVGAASAGNALGGVTGELRMALKLASELHVAPAMQELRQALVVAFAAMRERDAARQDLACVQEQLDNAIAEMEGCDRDQWRARAETAEAELARLRPGTRTIGDGEVPSIERERAARAAYYEDDEADRARWGMP